MPKEEWPGEALMTLPYSIKKSPTLFLAVLSTGSQPEKNILSLLANTLNWSKPNVYKSCLPKALSKSNTSLIWTQLWHVRIKPQTIHPKTAVSRHMCFRMPSDNLFQLRMARSKPATSSVGSSVWEPDWWQIVVLCHNCKCANAPEWICPMSKTFALRKVFTFSKPAAWSLYQGHWAATAMIASGRNQVCCTHWRGSQRSQWPKSMVLKNSAWNVKSNPELC